MAPCSPTVLLADDDDATRGYLRRALELAGYEVVEARNGQEALMKFASSHPSVMVMDYELGIPNGAEVVALVRGLPSATEAETPVVFVTGAARFTAAPGTTVLLKPVDPETLATAVDRALRR